MTALGIAVALFAEGPSDHRFLDRLLERTLTRELALRGLTVDVLPIQRLPPSAAEARAERIADGAKRMGGGFHLLAIHTDAGSDPSTACRERVDPGRALVLAEFGPDGRRVVGIAPRREMEAWALCDRAALARVLSARVDLEESGVPSRARDVERIADPKAVLDRIVAAARGGRRRRRRARGIDYLDLLADEVSFDALDEVPSYAAFRDKLRTALDELHFR